MDSDVEKLSDMDELGTVSVSGTDEIQSHQMATMQHPNDRDH